MPASIQTPSSPDVVDSWDEVKAGAAPLLVLGELARFVPGSGPLSALRLGSGHSNETFEIRRDGKSYVLRRPPRPPFPPSAHDVIREARVLGTLADLYERSPRPLVVCEDPNPIGAPFYLMAKIPGVVIRDRMPPELDDPEGRRGAVEAFVDALVEVHGIEWRGTPLAEIGRDGGYLERQLRRWRAQWDHNQTRSVAAIERIGDWLSTRMPIATETTLVHGDAKLDNAIFATRPPARLVALVDWEMATLGDPLADLGLLCGTYIGPGDEPDPLFDFSPATTAPGAPSREEIAELYARRSGRRIDELLWYETLALWKIAILLEGGYKRYLAGTTDDEFFLRLKKGLPRAAASILARAEGGRG
jgi:aminoglycoside phosphotransferase (APT) family kinase protein